VANILIHLQDFCQSGLNTLAYSVAQIEDAGCAHPFLTFGSFSLASLFLITR